MVDWVMIGDRRAEPTCAACSAPRRLSSGGLQLAGGHLAAALVAFQFEAHLLALLQGAQTRALDRRDVHEHVRAAGVRLDEAEALGGIEPLHGSNSHDCL